MIDGFLAVIGFVLGVFLTIQLIAAVYSVVDFQDNLQRYWPTIAGRIGGWLAVYALVLMLVPLPMEGGLVTGSKIMLGAHLWFIFTPTFLWWLYRTAEQKNYQKYLESLK